MITIPVGGTMLWLLWLHDEPMPEWKYILTWATLLIWGDIIAFLRYLGTKD